MPAPTPLPTSLIVEQAFAPLVHLEHLLLGLAVGLGVTVLVLIVLSKRNDKPGRVASLILEVFFPKYAPRHRSNRLERTYKSSPPSAETPINFKVATKPNFFSKAERAFMASLRPVVELHGLDVFPKVGLNDVFEDRPGAEPGQFARYSQMHIDYLLVSRQTGRIVAGIELDGPSHESERQQANDTKKAAVFKAANIPLLRFYNREQFDSEEIRIKLEDVLGTASRQLP